MNIRGCRPSRFTALIRAFGLAITQNLWSFRTAPCSEKSLTILWPYFGASKRSILLLPRCTDSCKIHRVELEEGDGSAIRLSQSGAEDGNQLKTRSGVQWYLHNQTEEFSRRQRMPRRNRETAAIAVCVLMMEDDHNVCRWISHLKGRYYANERLNGSTRAAWNLEHPDRYRPEESGLRDRVARTQSQWDDLSPVAAGKLHAN